jgi:hypothetical protein
MRREPCRGSQPDVCFECPPASWSAAGRLALRGPWLSLPRQRPARNSGLTAEVRRRRPRPRPMRRSRPGECTSASANDRARLASAESDGRAGEVPGAALTWTQQRAGIRSSRLGARGSCPRRTESLTTPRNARFGAGCQVGALRVRSPVPEVVNRKGSCSEAQRIIRGFRLVHARRASGTLADTDGSAGRRATARGSGRGRRPGRRSVAGSGGRAATRSRCRAR